MTFSQSHLCCYLPSEDIVDNLTWQQRGLFDVFFFFSAAISQVSFGEISSNICSLPGITLRNILMQDKCRVLMVLSVSLNLMYFNIIKPNLFDRIFERR